VYSVDDLVKEEERTIDLVKKGIRPII